MPYPNEHAARIMSPGRFEKESIRRKNVAPGVDIVMGRLKGEATMTAQAYRFKKENFTAEQARKWLEDHEVKFMSFEPATQTVQSFMTIRSKIMAMAAEAVLDLIPAETLDGIKAKDQHPFFQVFSICHEGVSQPSVLGEDAKPIAWFKRAVQSIKNVMTKGVKFFIGHNADNSTDNREEVGEVVADTQREIDGKLHHLVVGYFPDRARVVDMDICSQEAEWNLIQSAGGWIADKIEKLSAIALGKSAEDTPAFSGARRLGMVQAFEPAEPVKEIEVMDISTVPFNDLKAEVLRRQTFASQLFKLEDLKVDREFSAFFSKTEELDKQVKTLQDENKTLKETVTTTAKQAQLATAKPRLEKIIKELNYTDKQAAFVLKRLSDKVEDLTDAGLKKFAEVQTEIYKDAVATTEEPGNASSGAVTGASATTQVDSKDFTKAANNDMLSEDI